jgi:hypothetical protein
VFGAAEAGLFGIDRLQRSNICRVLKSVSPVPDYFLWGLFPGFRFWQLSPGWVCGSVGNAYRPSVSSGVQAHLEVAHSLLSPLLIES